VAAKWDADASASAFDLAVDMSYDDKSTALIRCRLRFNRAKLNQHLCRWHQVISPACTSHGCWADETPSHVVLHSLATSYVPLPVF